MRNAPTLATTTIRAGNGYRVMRTFIVSGGLHFLKGNPNPYFSLTYSAHRKGFPNQCQSGGAGHDEILERFPRFADIAALHLSDINGIPSYAEGNGWYFLAGALGGLGAEYHAGRSKQNFPEYREPTRDECLQMFADHVRLPLDDARAVAGWIKASAATYGNEGARAKFAEWIGQQKPRWKAEADACIAAHNLQIYGDELA